MKKLLHTFLCIPLCLIAHSVLADDTCSTACLTPCSTLCSSGVTCCRSIFIPRSVGDNLVHQALYRSYEYIPDRCDQTCFGGNFNIEYRFQQSRRGKNIARNLFGSSQLHFQGSAIKAGANSDPLALIADNFGLSPNTDSFIDFHPRIRNSIWDFQLYLDLDELWDGLFFQMNFPIAKSWWKLGMHGPLVATGVNNCSTSCSTTSFLPNPAQTPFNNGCMSSVYVPNTTTFNVVAPAPSFTTALSGSFLFGDMQTEWIAGHFTQCEQSSIKLASINMILGFTLYECPDYHIGAFARVAAPTGTGNDQCCSVINLFYPSIGENHWKAGGGLTGHAELYNCDNDHFVNAYFEGYVEYLFAHDQVRSFDFASKGCLSRYMLLKQFDASTNTYTGTMINGINFATRTIRTEIHAQGEGQFEVIYRNKCGFSAGVGYNFYGRSKEVCQGLENLCDTNVTTTQRYGFKGCAPIQAAGYVIPNVGTGMCSPDITTTPTPLAYTLDSTQSNAMIRSCGTVDNAQTLQVGCPGSDDGFIYVNTCANNVLNLETGIVTVASLTPAQVSSSTVPAISPTGTVTNDTPAPVYLDPFTDLNIKSGLLQSQVTNKLFGHIDYEWQDCGCRPTIRLGGEVEFASCRDLGAMNAWAIYLDGGVAF